MKIFLITTLAISTLCILEAPQPAQASPSDSNFHLARGGGHFGRGDEGMRAVPRAAEENRNEMGEGRNLDNASEGHTSEASRVEDHVHTLSGANAGEGVSDGGRLQHYDGGDWEGG